MTFSFVERSNTLVLSSIWFDISIILLEAIIAIIVIINSFGGLFFEFQKEKKKKISIFFSIYF